MRSNEVVKTLMRKIFFALGLLMTSVGSLAQTDDLAVMDSLAQSDAKILLQGRHS